MFFIGPGIDRTLTDDQFRLVAQIQGKMVIFGQCIFKDGENVVVEIPATSFFYILALKRTVFSLDKLQCSRDSSRTVGNESSPCSSWPSAKKDAAFCEAQIDYRCWNLRDKTARKRIEAILQC